MILSKQEIDCPEHKVWNEILGKTSYSPADGDIFIRPFIHHYLFITDASYERLVALFFGSYYVTTLDEVMPRVTDEDFLKTRDNIGEYYFKEHFFYTIQYYLFSKGTSSGCMRLRMVSHRLNLVILRINPWAQCLLSCFGMINRNRSAPK